MCWKRNRYFNINVSEIIFEKVVSFPCDSNIPIPVSQRIGELGLYVYIGVAATDILTIN